MRCSRTSPGRWRSAPRFGQWSALPALILDVQRSGQPEIWPHARAQGLEFPAPHISAGATSEPIRAWPDRLGTCASGCRYRSRHEPWPNVGPWAPVFAPFSAWPVFWPSTGDLWSDCLQAFADSPPDIAWRVSLRCLGSGLRSLLSFQIIGAPLALPLLRCVGRCSFRNEAHTISGNAGRRRPPHAGAAT